MSNTRFSFVTTPSAMREGIAYAQQIRVQHYIPPLHAASNGLIVVALVECGALVSFDHLRSYKRPALIILHDDDDLSFGPVGCPNLKRLLKWSAGVIVDATPPLPANYAQAVSDTLALERVLFVKTGADHLEHWLAAVPPKRRLRVLTPPAGSPSIRREDVQ